MISEIDSHQAMVDNIKDHERSYVFLYKKNSDLSTCALNNIRKASEEVNSINLYFADVSTVRDIHENYQVTSVPVLLSFEKGHFKNLYKGCNDYSYYKTLFENAVFFSATHEGPKQKRVTVYSTPTCTWCNTLKSYLRKNRIMFEDIDVSRDEKAAQDLVNRTGQKGVPQTDIEGTIVVGFDKQKINQLLDIKTS